MVSDEENVTPAIDTAPSDGLVLELYNRLPAQPPHTNTCMSSPSLS